MSESIKMTRSEINEAMARFFANGGEVTKLPAGPDWRFQAYGVRVPKSNNVDLTAMEDPSSKKQIKALEERTL